MGNTVYSNVSRASYVSGSAMKSTDEIFHQNIEKKVHSNMNPMNLGIREARDSESHPESLAIIIALDITGSMGHIPEQIVKDDLTHIMETLIKAGLPHIQIMFMGIGDHLADRGSLQVGQFESGDQELAMWLENTWLEGGGSGFNVPTAKESYPLAWLVAGHHTSIDCFEKRKQKGFLFTIGDEGFHDSYNTKTVTGLPCEESVSAEELLRAAREKYYVFHIHANYTGYRDHRRVLAQWDQILGTHILKAENNKEISMHIVDTILKSAKIQPVIEDDDSPAPDTMEKPNIML